MLMRKGSEIFEEFKTLIKENGEIGPYLYHLMKSWQVGKVSSDPQCVYPRSGIIKLLILFKLLDIPSINMALGGEFKRLLSLGKDVLYKVKNSTWIPWRSMLYEQSKSCAHSVHVNANVYKPWTLPCFILDDSDLPKRGIRIEKIGRIFSHVTKKHDLGFKCLNLCFWSGKHLLHLDFSLHGEGKDKNQGLTIKQLKNRYRKKRQINQAGYQRAKEVFCKKTDQALAMLRRAIKKGFQASYILADSWFFNRTMVSFALNNQVHLISRPKFNNWKYVYEDRNYILGKLINKLRYSKKRKWNRAFNMHHLTVPVLFQGLPVVIFFYKEKKRNTKWQALITTDKQIGSIQAFKIYQNRWSIEVSYKELKQHLQFGKCQSLDFDAHISDVTQSLMAYNYLSHIKAVKEYETIGHLFREVSSQWLKPTIMERFWQYLFDIIKQIAELINQSVEYLLDQVKINHEFINSMHRIFQDYDPDLGTES